MSVPEKSITARFFHLETGRESVKNWLALPLDDRKIVGTSRSQLDRLLDNDSVTLDTLKRAALAVGMQIEIDLRPFDAPLSYRLVDTSCHLATACPTSPTISRAPEYAIRMFFRVVYIAT